MTSKKNRTSVKGKTIKHNELDRWIEEFLKYLETKKNCSRLTIRNYKHYLERFSYWAKSSCPKLKLCDLDLKILKKYRFFLARYMLKNGQVLKKITQNYHLIALRSMLKFLAKRDVKTLAAEKIELLKTESRSLKFLTTEQIERLLSQPKISSIIGLRNKVILETLFSTGLRVSELVKLNREQIDFKRKEFGVIGRGGRPRVVFLSERACKWIEKYLEQREDNFKPLFIRFSGRVEKENNGEKMRLSSRTVQRIVKKYVKKAKLSVDATTHTLRHSFATDLLSHGADLKSVQDLLGHKNIATTQIYTHVTNAQLKKVHEKFHSGNEPD
jgi:site-specific recombinase XerD